MKNEEFDWNRDNLDSVTPLQGSPPLVEKCMMKEVILYKMKNGTAHCSSTMTGHMFLEAGIGAGI